MEAFGEEARPEHSSWRRKRERERESARASEREREREGDQIRGELHNMPQQCRHACVHQLICGLHRPGPDPAGDTQEGHQCAIHLLSVLENEFPGSYHTNGQCESDAIWLMLRGQRLAEYIDGMNLPVTERHRGGHDEKPMANKVQGWGPKIRGPRLLAKVHEFLA